MDDVKKKAFQQFKKDLESQMFYGNGFDKNVWYHKSKQERRRKRPGTPTIPSLKAMLEGSL